MAGCAWVECELRCPECDTLYDDVAWMPWGGVHGQDVHRGPVYAFGMSLMWCCDEAGEIHGDTHYTDRGCMNLGDPRFPNVDVFSDRAVGGPCAGCGVHLAASK